MDISTVTTTPRSLLTDRQKIRLLRRHKYEVQLTRDMYRRACRRLAEALRLTGYMKDAA